MQIVEVLQETEPGLEDTEHSFNIVSNRFEFGRPFQPWDYQLFRVSLETQDTASDGTHRHKLGTRQ